jgi:hypothetical protein
MHTPELEDGSRDCRVSYDLLGGTGCILDELKRGDAADKKKSLFRQLYNKGQILECCIEFPNLGRREGTGSEEICKSLLLLGLMAASKFCEEERRRPLLTHCRCK